MHYVLLTMKILRNLGIGIVATISLFSLYILGSTIAQYLGYPQRGGVDWGVSVLYSSLLMIPSTFFTMWLYRKLANKYVFATVLGFGFFALLSSMVMGNQFLGSVWGYPYRFLYFQFCALFVFFILLKLQLTNQSNECGKPHRTN